MDSMRARTALQPQNLPTPDREEWKYTNLARALPKDLRDDAAPEPEILIHKIRGQVCGQPEEILFTGCEGIETRPRLKVVLEEGASLTLIERHEGQGAYWKNMVSAIEIGDNAVLRHIRLQDEAPEAVQTSMVRITLGRDALYEGFSLNAGARLTRHDIHAEITGINAECVFNGVNLLGGTQHGDTTILIEHRAPHGRSSQFYRTLLDDRARGVFQGKVYVHKEAQKTDAYQLSNALLLSQGAEMDTKPELEIYADDVKCSHGSTTGQLDDEPLFYLRSRGLNEAQARMLLMQAFVNEAVDKIADESVRDEVRGRAEQWLSRALQK